MPFIGFHSAMVITSAPLAARPVFIHSIYLIYEFWAGNNYPYSPHLQGGMKFATQISPLLNFDSRALNR